MSRSKVIAVSIVIIAVFGIAMIDGAVANDKMKWHGTGITVKWEQIEVGDEEGHVIAITQSKQIHINETTGEKSTSVSMGLMDINPKMGQASGHGYGVNFEKDGSKIVRSWEGKAVGEDHWQGAWKVIKGTGKYEGATGGGTWDSYSLAPQYEYLEVEGEFKVPGQ
jgi:hypothetical protein